VVRLLRTNATVVAIKRSGRAVVAVCTFGRSGGDCGDRGLHVDGGVGGAVHHIRSEMGDVELGFHCYVV